MESCGNRVCLLDTFKLECGAPWRKSESIRDGRDDVEWERREGRDIRGSKRCEGSFKGCGCSRVRDGSIRFFSGILICLLVCSRRGCVDSGVPRRDIELRLPWISAALLDRELVSRGASCSLLFLFWLEFMECFGVVGLFC